jgi:hypothetical protein
MDEDSVKGSGQRAVETGAIIGVTGRACALPGFAIVNRFGDPEEIMGGNEDDAEVER